MLGDGGLTAPHRRAFRAALVDLLPEGVELAVWGVDTSDETLLPDEAIAVRNAVPSRRREFARGRACARVALARLGLAGPVPVGEDRQPAWPPGVVGSVTHTGELIAAAVARSRGLDALGIDVEAVQPLSAEVRASVVHADDRVAAGDATGLVVFSAKESVFKALYPASRVWMGFDAVAVRDAGPGGALGAVPTGRGPVAPGLEDLRGGYRVSPGWVATAFWLRRGEVGRTRGGAGSKPVSRGG